MQICVIHFQANFARKNHWKRITFFSKMKNKNKKFQTKKIRQKNTKWSTLQKTFTSEKRKTKMCYWTKGITQNFHPQKKFFENKIEYQKIFFTRIVRFEKWRKCVIRWKEKMTENVGNFLTKQKCYSMVLHLKVLPIFLSFRWWIFFTVFLCYFYRNFAHKKQKNVNEKLCFLKGWKKEKICKRKKWQNLLWILRQKVNFVLFKSGLKLGEKRKTKNGEKQCGFVFFCKIVLYITYLVFRKYSTDKMLYEQHIF